MIFVWWVSFGTRVFKKGGETDVAVYGCRRGASFFPVCIGCPVHTLIASDTFSFL